MLPEANYYTPDADIAWLVRQFEFIRYDGSNELTDKFVPREDASIVFQFGAQPRMVCPVDQQLPRYFIAPPSPSANSIRIRGKLDCMIVTCKPTVLSRVFNLSLAPAGKIYISLDDDAFGPVWKKMKAERTVENRTAVFTGLVKRIHSQRYIPDETDLIYEAILEKGINTPLYDIISRFPVSERTLQRRFRRRLGTTPKTLVRLMRINYLWDSISAGKKIDYHDLVFLGNYFDQTHLIKDFKSITGETPDAFFRRNLRMARILSGK